MRLAHLGREDSPGVAAVSEQRHIEDCRRVAQTGDLVGAWSLRQQCAVRLHLVLLQQHQAVTLQCTELQP